MEPDTLRALFVALRDVNVGYVLVGALAMDVLGIGRFTDAAARACTVCLVRTGNDSAL